MFFNRPNCASNERSCVFARRCASNTDSSVIHCAASTFQASVAEASNATKSAASSRRPATADFEANIDATTTTSISTAQSAKAANSTTTTQISAAATAAATTATYSYGNPAEAATCYDAGKNSDFGKCMGLCKRMREVKRKTYPQYCEFLF